VDTIDRLCAAARQYGASDLFLHAGRVPQIRLEGRLAPLDEAALAPAEVDAFWTRCGVPLETADHDGGFIAADGTRFRVSFFRSFDGRGAVMRQILTEIPTLDGLGLPSALLTSWISRPSGLILVTGPTGSGKSTTLAACLEWMNRNTSRHIVTIEDPIEYLFEPNLSVFTQREVGTDTPSFSEGLRRALRQSPDVILVGEIRDVASALTALQAAQTGHLVLSTLHGTNAIDSLERIARLCNTNDRAGMLQILGQQLIGVLCQRLVPGAGGGSVVVVEHLENRGATRKWIAEEQFLTLSDFIARGDNPANIPFLRSLADRVRTGRITEETALHLAPNAHELQRELRGIGRVAAVPPAATAPTPIPTPI
jgi:pilus retraction protein PilT